MIGGLSLWVPKDAAQTGSPEVHDHVEPINLRVSPPAPIKAPEPPDFRMDGLSLSPEGARLAAATPPLMAAPEPITTPKMDAIDHRANQRLADRDRAVRAHESAHRAHAGRYAGAPTYTFERGSDGRIYIAGGQLTIDMKPVPNDPAATVQKMQVLEKAALAPANSSSADRAVANLARGEGAQAKQQLKLNTDRERALESIREEQQKRQEEIEKEIYGGASSYAVSFDRAEFTGGLKTGISTGGENLTAGGLQTAGVGDQQAGSNELAEFLSGRSEDE